MSKQSENKFYNTLEGPDGTATHSGWNYFYVSFSKYRDDCIALSQNVLSSNFEVSINSLSRYTSCVYSLAQQVFSFYPEEKEKKLISEWVDLNDKVNDFLSLISDRDFRNQMSMEGKLRINKELRIELLKYFNKVDRLAAEAGLLVNKEDKGSSEPKKGLIGIK